MVINGVRYRTYQSAYRRRTPGLPRSRNLLLLALDMHPVREPLCCCRAPGDALPACLGGCERWRPAPLAAGAVEACFGPRGGLLLAIVQYPNLFLTAIACECARRRARSPIFVAARPGCQRGLLI
jgi:hypothetical protein